MTVSVILILVMLLLSAFFSGMEIAFVSKNRLKLEIDRKQSGLLDFVAKVFERHPGQYITSILVGNNIALVVYSLYMSSLLRALAAQGGSVLAETLISTVVIIFVAEYLPKSIVKGNPNFYYRAFAPLLFVFYILLYPIVWLTTVVSYVILRLFGCRMKRQAPAADFNRTDLESLIEGSTEVQHDEENEIKLFQNALDFADLRVRDCMVPRIDVEAVELSTSVEELTRRFVESKYSRIFVWEGSIDNIVGYVNSKSLFRQPADLRKVLMTAYFVPETMPLQALLEHFIKHRSYIAVVIDEFGGTAGIISRARTDFRRDRGRARRAGYDREAGRRERVRLFVPARSEIPQRTLRARHRGEPRIRHAGGLHHLASGRDSFCRSVAYGRRPRNPRVAHDPFAHRAGAGQTVVSFFSSDQRVNYE